MLGDACAGDQVAGALLTKLLARMVDEEIGLGINEETGAVGELEPEMVVLSATTAYNRAHEVRAAAAALPFVRQRRRLEST
jgi:hypothetical protein